MNKTPIEWTNYSSNPFKALHKAARYERDQEGRLVCVKCGMPRERSTDLFNICVKISPGCARCYAATLTHRWGGPDYVKKSLECFEPVLVEKELEKILRCTLHADQRMVFPFDMTDIFLEFWPDEFIDRFFAVAALRPDLIFQVLTKRAERMYRYCTEASGSRHPTHRDNGFCIEREICIRRAYQSFGKDKASAISFPFPNVWLGVSVEDQDTADERIPWLLRTPAALHWVSYEPALSLVDFTRYLGPSYTSCQQKNTSTIARLARAAAEHHGESYLDWIVIGGESGPGARPFDIQWARDCIAQCKAAGVACFVKQVGAHSVITEEQWAKEFHGSIKLENSHWRWVTTDKKGGDINEWPVDLRVREFPEIARIGR